MSLLKVYVCFFILIYGAMRPFRLAPDFCIDNFKRTYQFLSGFFCVFSVPILLLLPYQWSRAYRLALSFLP